MTLAPRTIDELCDAVAGSAPRPLRIRGGGTKAIVPADDATLDLRGLTGIVAYDPAECVITALAGTPLREIEGVLSAHGQYLPFDPPLVRAGATIGGTVAAALSGSGRHRYGGVRDFVIGARVVDGQGRLLRSGGQVVKNAAGFLLHHALVGSAGRYGVIAELSFKVFPRPAATLTLRAVAPSLEEAIGGYRRVGASVHDLDALDLDVGAATTWVRLAGAAATLSARAARIGEVLAPQSVEILAGDDDARIWVEAGEFAWAPSGDRLVKVPASPSQLAAIAAGISGLGIARGICGGAAVLLASSAPLDAIAAALPRPSTAVVVRGPECGRVIGAAHDTLFDERVRSTLDPGMRFL